MNLIQLKYAIEVANAGSISKAAQHLYMNQPHLSKSIKDLEDSLGIKIFERTTKGVIPTKVGEEFLSHAKDVMTQVDQIESMYLPQAKNSIKLAIAVPRASYVSKAFTDFLKQTNDPGKIIDINYHETNSIDSIRSVYKCDTNLGIIRFPKADLQYFQNLLESKSLDYKKLNKFHYVLLMSKMHKLANKKIIHLTDLQESTVLMHGDISVHSLPLSALNKNIKPIEPKRKISIYERGSQFEVLGNITDSYMWVSPMPESALDRYDLIQRKCVDMTSQFIDLLIFRKNYHFSPEDTIFMECLNNVVENINQFE